MPQAKIRQILRLLRKRYGEIQSFLDHRNAFELLCAICLSAQCTDARVNLSTPALFAKYPDVQSLARAKQKDVEALVKSCGFYKNKARNLIKMAQQLLSRHGGQIPDNKDSLVALAGVGPKTANVLLGQWFHKNEGIAVDTHVKRISKRLGLSSETDPLKVEKDLKQIVPQKSWNIFSLWLIQHGRDTCIARRPRCEFCFLRTRCKTNILDSAITGTKA